MNKEYFNTDERKIFITFKKAIDNAEEMLKWKLTKEEKKNLRTCITFGMKVFDSIAVSLSDKSLSNIVKSISKMKFTIEDKYAIELYNRKIDTNLENCYEKNRDYFKLVELLMDKNCRDCTTSCRQCEIYDEFEAHLIPSGGYGYDNCMYAYSSVRKDI